MDQLHPRQVWHLIVCDEQLVTDALQSPPSLRPVSDGIHVVSGPIQHELTGPQDAPVIVGIKDPRPGITTISRFKAELTVAGEGRRSVSGGEAVCGRGKETFHDSGGWTLRARSGC